MTDNTLLPSRSKALTKLEALFTADCKALLSYYEKPMKAELAEHLFKVVTLLGGYCIASYADANKAESLHTAYRVEEMLLLKKHRSKLKEYYASGLFTYFSMTNLYDKEIYTDEQLEILPVKQHVLSSAEFERFVASCKQLLTTILRNEYLKDEDADEKDPTSIINADDASEHIDTNTGFTRKLQLLAIYYLLVARGVEMRVNASVSDVTRLAHLITGIKFTTLQNSEIYKKMRMLSDPSKHKAADLLLIRAYFQKAGLHEAVTDIDEALQKDHRKNSTD